MRRTIAFVALLVSFPLTLSACSPDCLWGASVLTWVDGNGNGIWDTDEPPVEGVQFQVNDIRNGYLNVGDYTSSDWEGRAEITVWLPGCPSAKFEVLAIPPEGYILQNAGTIQVEGSDDGRDSPILFPLRYGPGFSTPTPYAPKLHCTTYAIGAEELRLAPDGGIWALTWDGGAVFDRGSGNWQFYSINQELMPYPEKIDIGMEGDVWLRSSNSIGVLQDGAWAISQQDGNFPDSWVSGIRSPIDGGYWFVVSGPRTMFAYFDPFTSSWSLYGPEGGMNNLDLGVTLIQGGSVWFALFEDGLHNPLPSALPITGLSIESDHQFTADEYNPVPMDWWIDDMEIDLIGRAWIMHTYGISSFSPSSGEWIDHVSPSPFDYVGAPVDLAIGPDNAIWGLYSDNHPRILEFIPSEIGLGESVWISFDPRDGIPDNAWVRSLLIDHSGDIWIGYGSQDITAHCKQIR